VYTATIRADNAKMAAKVIKQNIPTFVMIAGPEERGGIWGCVYINANEDMMITITPPVDINDTVRKFMG